MKHYSKEHKQSVITKMMPPYNVRVSELADETGISQQTLYNWRQKSREEGEVVPGDGLLVIGNVSEAHTKLQIDTNCCSKISFSNNDQRVGNWVWSPGIDNYDRRRTDAPFERSRMTAPHKALVSRDHSGSWFALLLTYTPQKGRKLLLSRRNKKQTLATGH